MDHRKGQRFDDNETQSNGGQGPGPNWRIWPLEMRIGQRTKRPNGSEDRMWRRRKRRRTGTELSKKTILIPIILIMLGLLGIGIGAEAEDNAVAPDRQLEGIGRKRTEAEEVRIEEEEEGAEGGEDDPNRQSQLASYHPPALRSGPRSPSPIRPHSQFSDLDYSIVVGAPAIQAHISRHSWERYQRFKEETCRKVAEADMVGQRLNSTESAYFHWEENEFHRELRKKLLPQTRDGSFRSLVNSNLLGTMDPRLFASEPRSLCKAKRLVDEEDERQKLIKEEKHRFEDFLINKVFSPTV